MESPALDEQVDTQKHPIIRLGMMSSKAIERVEANAEANLNANKEQLKTVLEQAWDETVEVSPAWDETVTTGYTCSCGAVK